MKLLYLTDTHIRGTSPKSRKDDFLSTVKSKLNEVSDIIKRENVDYILHGGDFFDRPDVSISVINEIAPILKSFSKPLYIISGNHDIYGHNPKTLYRSMLGLLDGLNILEIINDRSVLLTKNDITVQLSGSPYIYGLDRKEHRDKYVLTDRDPKADYAIHLVHGFLMDKKFLKQVPHTLITDILDTKADLTISGHYHYGFPMQTIDGKTFVNPGALVRISNSKIELKRRPKVLLIEATKEALDVKEIYLKSAKPGEEVLDRTEIEQHRFKQQEIHAFKEIVERSANMDQINLTSLITDIAKNEEINRKVRDEAIRRITETEMKGSD